MKMLISKSHITQLKCVQTNLANMWIKLVDPIMLSAVSKAELPARIVRSLSA